LINIRFLFSLVLFFNTGFNVFCQETNSLQAVIQSNHSSPIEIFVENSNGTLLLTSDYKTCKLWNWRTGELLRSFNSEYANFNKNGDIIIAKKIGRGYSEVSVVNKNTLNVQTTNYINNASNSFQWNLDSTALIISDDESKSTIINPHTLKIIHTFDATDVKSNGKDILVANKFRFRSGYQYTISRMDFSGTVYWTKKLRAKQKFALDISFYCDSSQFIYKERKNGKRKYYIVAYEIASGERIEPIGNEKVNLDFGYCYRNEQKIGEDIYAIRNCPGKFDSRFVKFEDGNEENETIIASNVHSFSLLKGNQEIALSTKSGDFQLFNIQNDSLYSKMRPKGSPSEIINSFMLDEYYYFFTKRGRVYSFNTFTLKLDKLGESNSFGFLNIGVNHNIGKAIFYFEQYDNEGSPTVNHVSKYYIVEKNKIVKYDGRPTAMLENSKYLLIEKGADLKWILNLETGRENKIGHYDEAQFSPDRKHIVLAASSKIDLYEVNQERIVQTLDFTKLEKSSSNLGYDRNAKYDENFKIQINWNSNSDFFNAKYTRHSKVFSKNMNLKLEDIGKKKLSTLESTLIKDRKNNLFIKRDGDSSVFIKKLTGVEGNFIDNNIGFNKILITRDYNYSSLSTDVYLLDVSTLKETKIQLDSAKTLMADYKLIKSGEELKLFLLNSESINYYDAISGKKIDEIKLPSGRYDFIHLMKGKNTIAYNKAYDGSYGGLLIKVNNETGEKFAYPPGEQIIFSSLFFIGKNTSYYDRLLNGNRDWRSFYSGNKMADIQLNNEKNKFVLTYSTNGNLNIYDFDSNERIAVITLIDNQYFIITPDNYYVKPANLTNVNFSRNQKLFAFEQFDLKYNRPDIILDRLGMADKSLIEAYRNIYLKRLKKLGFTEEMLKDDYNLPELKIENFEQLLKNTDENSIELILNLKDSKHNLDRINVWINDVAVFGTGGISIREENTKEYRTSLNVKLAKGKNKIQISALNLAGAESYKETITMNCSAGNDKSDLYLISIGESIFKESEFNLTYASKDAMDMVKLFKENNFYNNIYSKTLINNEVTKNNVKALSTFLEKADINDQVLIFIAGHGVLDANLDYYFGTYDINFNNPSERGLAYEDLEALLDGIAPLKKTLLIDACHSGEIDKEEVELLAKETTEMGNIQFRTVGSSIAPKLGLQNTSELTKSLFTDLRKGTGATVISSAGGMEYAMEGEDWSNGLFTYCLINGIKSKAADLDNNGEIWLSELQKYVSEQVIILSAGRQQPTSRIENQTLDFRIW
jgi:hypothetical protein